MKKIFFFFIFLAFLTEISAQKKHETLELIKGFKEWNLLVNGETLLGFIENGPSKGSYYLSGWETKPLMSYKVLPGTETLTLEITITLPEENKTEVWYWSKYTEQELVTKTITYNQKCTYSTFTNESVNSGSNTCSISCATKVNITDGSYVVDLTRAGVHCDQNDNNTKIKAKQFFDEILGKQYVSSKKLVDTFALGEKCTIEKVDGGIKINGHYFREI